MTNDATRAIVAHAPRTAGGGWVACQRGARLLMARMVVLAMVLSGDAALAAVNLVASAQAGSAGTAASIVVAAPAGTASGDFMIAAITQATTSTITAPAGWTTLLTSNGTRNPRLRVFTKVATASEPANYTFTSSVTDEIAGAISSYRGVQSGTPIGTARGITANASAVSSTAPSVSPAVANTMLVSIWATLDATITKPVAMTATFDSTAGSGASAIRLASAYQAIAATGATGTRVASLSASRTSNGASLALRPGYAISGTVFEDRNYGGGAGRSLAGSSGATLNAARVELYNSAGSYVSSTTSAGAGAYSFTGLAAGTFYVRVVNASVQSTRSGSTAALRGVMTYRTHGSSGSVVAVTDWVGGSNPALVDPGNGSSGTSFNTSTYVFSAGLTGTAQTVTPVTLSATDLTGVDFGFNFDTVVNINDSGAGSLRQALTNANALGGDSLLIQMGRPVAVENLIFMLPNGTAAAGLRSSLSAFTSGIATIVPASALPVITASVVLDAQTQPGWAVTPLIELNGSSTASHCIAVTGGSITLRGWIINRCPSNGVHLVGGSGHVVQGNWIGLNSAGTAASNVGGAGFAGVYVDNTNGVLIGGTTATQRNVLSGTTYAGIYLEHDLANVVVQGNYIGTNISGSAAVGNAIGGIRWSSSASNITGVTIGGSGVGAGNLISGNTGAGIRVTLGAPTISGNLIGVNAAGTAALPNTSDGITLQTQVDGAVIGGTSVAARNVISGNGNSGISATSGTVINTTVQGNYIGTNAAGTAAIGNSNDGINLDGSNAVTIGGTISGAGNLISGNGAIGVKVQGTSSGVAILGNSIHSNNGLGIDLAANGVTLNDAAKTAGQPNLLMDQPVFTSARARGNQLTVAGYIGSAAGQSLFAGSRVDIFVSSNDASGYGEGQTYLGALTADASGNFSGTVTMAVSTLTIGNKLTGTATDAGNNSSEFGANFNGLIVDFVVNSNLDEPDSSVGDGQCRTASGVCSLRAAMTELNALAVGGSTPLISFNIPGCTAYGAAGCVITPATALPSMTREMSLDATTQPGWNSSSFAPLVVLDGAATPAATSGLVLSANNSSVRGLVIQGFNGSGISVAGSAATVVGNWIGLNVAGTGAAGNGTNGVTIGGATARVGGNTAADRNVIGGNGGAGIYVNASGASLQGNYIGSNAAGSAAVANQHGIRSLASSGLTIGGSGAGQGNVISGNSGNGLYFDASNSNVTVQGNLIGRDAGDSAALGNGGHGVFVNNSGCCAGLTGSSVGGSATGAANTIAHNGASGIGIAAGHATQLAISANTIYGNGGLGIDLGNDDVSGNDGLKNGSAPNQAIDHPVFTGAGINPAGTAMTVFGYVGTGSGQAAFAGSRIEVFKAAADPSSYGEGQLYLGFLTADASGRFTGTLNFVAGTLAIGDTVTATATDGSGNTSEYGPNWVSTTVAALTPAGFEAVETDTAAGATSGPLRTRIAGVAGTVDIIALAPSGAGLHPGFTGSVSLRWVDARNDSGAASGSCRASWLDLGSAGTASLTNASRVSVGVAAPAGATRVMRLKMSYTSGGTTVVACSADAFAAIPASMSLAASDGTASTAGTTRALGNSAAGGGVVHRAGQPFTITATALDALGNVMTGYDGTPTLAITGCLLPAGCTAAALSATAVAAVAGVYTHNAVSYAEVGAITLQLSDTGYADIDAADTAAAARLVSSSSASAGRFVPDSLSASISLTPQLATANGACLASGSGATFFGQGFGWTLVPQVTVTARNAAGATTQFWTGSLMKLTPASATPSMAASGVGAATLSSSFGALSVVDLGAGQARFNASALDRFVLELPAAVLQTSLSPGLAWTLDVTDSTEAVVAGNPTLTTSTSQGGLAFDAGGVFHSGRLALAPGHGDARSGVRVLLQLQRYAAAGWVTMTEDRGCVTVAPANLGVESPSGVFSTTNSCAAPATASSTTRGGRAWIALPATPAASPGRLTMRLAGAAATGNACASLNVSQALVPLNQSWLLGGSGGAGPVALATWGRANREMVLRREVW